MANKEQEKPTSQRAIIFQGGGALGAYEAGVFEVLYNKLMEEDKEKGSEDRPLFDIVAGASIGAVNAALLVNHVLEKKRQNTNLKISECWEGSAAALSQFWSELSNVVWWHPKSLIDNWLRNPLISGVWDFANSNSEAWINNYKFFSKMAKDIIALNPLWDYASENFPAPTWSEKPPYWQSINLKKEDWRERWPQILSYFLWPDNYSPIASGESARRYYSYWWSLLVGAPGILTPAVIPIMSSIFQPDTKFFLNSFFRFNNAPLEQSLKKYWNYDKYPTIKTNPSDVKINSKDNPPRLLLVAVDALDSTTAVSFDSYAYNGKDCELCPEEFRDNKEYIDHLYKRHKNEVKHFQKDSSDELEKSGIWKSVYGGEQNAHTIFYDGVELNHVRASMSTHQRYKYPEIEVVTTKDKKEKSRIFWDGAYLSNTPLREVIQAHKNYWKEVVTTEKNEEIPALEVYIVNLYPTTEKSFSSDADTIQDREIDIKFHDRTSYDVKVAELTTDYVDLSKQLKKLVERAIKNIDDSDKKGKLEKDLGELMSKETRGKSRSGKSRAYNKLIQNRFEISKITYIERSDDGDTIFGKAFDFSQSTIERLKHKGRLDADFHVEFERISTEIRASLLISDDKDETDKKRYKLDQILQRIKLAAKHEDTEEIRSNLKNLIEFVNNNKTFIGIQPEPFIDRINKLIEVAEQFKM